MTEYVTPLSIIIPVYNEEIILENVIDNLIIDLNEILTQYEIIIVENGSNDSTINITEKLKLKYKNLISIHLSEANYGKALRQGVKSANYDYLINFSIDFIDIDFLKNALSMISKYDLIIGSKRIGNGDSRSIYRKIGTIGYNMILNLFIKMPFKDTHGLKLYNTKIAKKYEKQCVSQSDIFDEELIYRTYKGGHAIKEIGVMVKDIRPARTSILSRAFKAIFYLNYLRKNLKD